MNNYINFLTNTILFKGLEPNEIEQILDSYPFFTKKYHTNESIYHAGEKITHAGLVLSGFVDVIHQSLHGTDNLVIRTNPGELFGASFSYSQQINFFSDIRSSCESEILFFHISPSQESQWDNICYQKFLKNYLYIISCDNILLNTKMQLLTQKTLREKLYQYFAFLSYEANSSEFFLPFNREQLACFLFSERSSISRELSSMQKEGILKIWKNHVILLKKPENF